MIQNRAISPLKFKKQKVTSQLQLWVYNSENRFVVSFYHNTCRVKRVNRFFENNLFWATLIIIIPWLTIYLRVFILHQVVNPTILLLHLKHWQEWCCQKGILAHETLTLNIETLNVDVFKVSPQLLAETLTWTFYPHHATSVLLRKPSSSWSWELPAPHCGRTGSLEVPHRWWIFNSMKIISKNFENVNQQSHCRIKNHLSSSFSCLAATVFSSCCSSRAPWHWKLSPQAPWPVIIFKLKWPFSLSVF